MDTSFGMGCTLSGPGRGDCEHFVGLPGKSIPGQHDGPDDTVDCYGKPNGWCWSCWKSYRLSESQSELSILRSQVDRLTGERDEARTMQSVANNLAETLLAERDQAIKCVSMWLAANASDGWIDKLRQERDQALLDGIQAKAKVVADKLAALDAQTPPVAPTP